MTIDQLKTILTNRLLFLASQRNYASVIGDVERILNLDNEIQEIEITLSQLNSL